MSEFNDRVIAEFRAGRGHVGAWGTNLVLIHHRGVRTGTARVNPAMSLRDETFTRMRSDEARCAGDDDVHARDSC